jgi:hypothetical protein
MLVVTLTYLGKTLDLSKFSSPIRKVPVSGDQDVFVADLFGCTMVIRTQAPIFQLTVPGGWMAKTALAIWFFNRVRPPAASWIIFERVLLTTNCL